MIALVRLNLRRWRVHKSRTALSLVGVAIGVALVVAVSAVYGSLTTSIERSTSDLAGKADLEVGAVTESGLDAPLVDEIARVPGVRSAVPMVRSTVVIGRQETLLFGFDARAGDLVSRTTKPDQRTIEALASGKVVVGKGLAKLVGARVDQPLGVTSPAGTTPAVVGSVIGDAGAMRINRGVFALAALPVAEQLSGRPGRLDSVLVVAAPHTDTEALQHQLEKVVAGRASIGSPKLRAAQAKASTKSLQQGLLMSAVMALAVGAFLVFNTMNMAALERRRELATLRAIGGRRPALMRAFLGEAAFLGLVGSMVGAAAGVLMARQLVRALPEYIVASFGVRVGFVLPPSAVPVAVVAGVVATLVAAYLPARRALAVAPVEAMRPEGVLESAGEGERISWGPTIVGALIFLGGLAVCLAGPKDAGMVGLGMMLLGGPTLLYGAASELVKVVAALARPFGAAGELAAESVSRSPRRAWATASAVMLAVGLVVAQNGVTRDAKAAIHDNLAPIEAADLYVSTAGNANFSSSVLFPADAEARMAALPGVARVAGSQFAFATIGTDRVMLQGVEDGVYDPSLVLVRPEARAELLAGRGAVLSTRFAELHGLHRGDQLEVPTPSGIQHLPVVDIIESFKWDRGLIVTSLPVLSSWFGRPGVGDIYVQAAPGADKAAVRAAVAQYTSTLPFPVTVETGRQFMTSIAAAADQVQSGFKAMQLIIVLAALLAVLNAMLIAVIERRREFGILRAIGTGRRMLRNMVAGESMAVGAVAGVLGLFVGVVSQYAATASVGQSTGYPFHYHFRLAPLAIAVIAGAVVTVVGGALPARRAARVNVIEAIGYE